MFDWLFGAKQAAEQRGQEDGRNGWNMPDWADVADLVPYREGMTGQEHNAAANEVWSAYAAGHNAGRQGHEAK